MLEDKQRILIIGNSGSGKSTFGKFLSRKLGLPLIHLDKNFWKPGWVKSEPDEWFETVSKLTSGEKWIIEGNYGRTLKLRAVRADLIYFFDYSSAFCLYRIWKRSILGKFTNSKRIDLADGCEERFPDREFIRYVWRFYKVSRPFIYSVFEEINFNKSNLVVFNNRKKFKAYMEYLNH